MKDYIALAAQYQADVRSGAIPACKWVRLACERNRRDLDRQDSPGFPYHFDPVRAVNICRFAELLPYVSGKGFAEVIGYDEKERAIWKKLELQPWQCWILTTLYGWVDAEQLRRFRVGLVLIPRKNSKSTMGAVMALYGLTAEQEPGAQCYSAATTRDQAKAVAEIAWEMAKRSPQLQEFYGVKLGSPTTRSLSVPATASKFMPLSADANSLDGLNVSVAIVDELHAHKRADVWNVLDTGTGARLQPQIIAITTAGVDLGGICHQKLSYLEKLLEQTATDETFFGINYTIDAGDDIRDPIVQRKANPNYGISVQPKDLERKIAESQQQTQASENNILTKHFNVWIRAESTWLPIDRWRACGDASLKMEQFKGVPCWIGVDLAEVKDVTALVLIFMPSPGRWVMFGRYYLPIATIRKSPVAQMSGWVRSGQLIQTDGEQTDYRRVEDDIMQLCEQFKVQHVCFDRALASQMMQSLVRRCAERMGMDEAQQFVLTVPQNPQMYTATTQFVERLVLSRTIQHDANPVMEWMIGNLVLFRVNGDGGEVVVRKAGGKDSPNKIDGPVAMFTAFDVAMRGVPEPVGVLAEWL